MKLQQALEHHHRAITLLNSTYKTFEDPKILLSIIRELNQSLEALLISGKHPLKQKITQILHKKQQSPVEFRRQKKYVLCDENYNIETISVEEVQSFCDDIKALIRLKYRKE